jgi:hypothetical protein
VKTKLTCPSCLRVLSSNDVEWLCACSKQAPPIDYRPSGNRDRQKDLLKQGIPCEQGCGNRRVQLQAKDCPVRLPATAADSAIWQGNTVVIGMGTSSQCSANWAAAALIWTVLSGASRDGQWVYANKLAWASCQSYARLRAGLCKFDGGMARFHRIDPNGETGASLSIAARSIGAQPNIQDWFKIANCASSQDEDAGLRLARADAVILAIEASNLRLSEDRKMAYEHARALTDVQTRGKNSRHRQDWFVLLLDSERRFMTSLSPGDRRDSPGAPTLPLPAAEGYVFENLRLRELWRLLFDAAGALKPLYAASPIGENSHYGMGPWIDFVSQMTQKRN